MPKLSYKLSLAAKTDCGRVRANNEDTVVCYDLEARRKLRAVGTEVRLDGRGVLLVLSDGMGGANAGEVASRLAVDTFIAMLLAEGPEDPLAKPELTVRIIQNAVDKAHQAISEAAIRNAHYEGMGATLTVLWLVRDRAFLVQVGDSRLYAVDSRQAVQISEDQTPVALLLKTGKLTPEQARRHPQRNLLEQALGAGLPRVNPAISPFPTTGGECFLLCSDGLSDALEPERLWSIITERARWNLPAACTYLVDAANEASGQDNISVILCRLTPQLVKEPQA